MDKATTILIIAQNGLKTAETLLNADAAKADKQAPKAADKQAADKLTKKAKSARKLASILAAADAGITAYLSESNDADS